MISIKPIKGFNSFSLVFNSGRKFYNKELIAVFVQDDKPDAPALICKCNEENTFYYGVTASKKINKKAVTRNRVKRLLRESIRKIFSEKYKMSEQPAFKYAVFSWRLPVNHPKLLRLNDVEPAVNDVIEAAESYFRKKGGILT